MTDLTPIGPYASKALEYGLAIVYLLLFIPFWKFVMKKEAAVERSAVPELFPVPHDVKLHRGHTWLRRAPGATLAVGLDDFGHRLLGPLDAVELPRVGSLVEQNKTAFKVSVEGHTFPLRSPITGRVVAVNHEALEHPDRLLQDPYRSAWLVRVAPKRRQANGLLGGEAARRFLGDVSGWVSFSPSLGALAQDGGTPVHGFARELDPAGWPALVEKHFLVGDDPPTANGASSGPRAGLMIALAALLISGAAIARDLPKLPKDISLPRSGDSPGTVVFRHLSHVDTGSPDCLSCHPKLFPILEQAASKRRPVTHGAMEAGKACGACHDGNNATGLDDCTKCHSGTR